MVCDLESLLEKIRSCRKCPLPKGSYPVFSPVLKTNFLLIGQAPGVEETKKGLPFVGKAGRRLFSWLKEVGIEEDDFRKRVYITQVVKCFPGKGKRGDLKPPKEQVRNCFSYLREEISLLDPDLIIPVGTLAIESLLGKKRLIEVVGKRLEVDLFGRKRVLLPLPHPSGVSVWSYKKEHIFLIERAIKGIRRYFRRS